MGTSKRERQKAGHQARLSVERAQMARYRRRRRLTLISVSVVGAIAVVGLFVVLSQSGSSTSTAATTSTSTTSTDPPLASVAGQPCVALADTLPAGAPDVPVPVGAPPTDLTSQDLVVGSGTPAAVGDDITVNYVGVACSSGKIFDSSWTRGQAATFPLQEGGLIEGWVQGIPGMQPGGRRLLVIPPSLGYGSTGQSASSIAPDETLVFVVDMVSAAPATTTTTAAP